MLLRSDLRRFTKRIVCGLTILPSMARRASVLGQFKGSTVYRRGGQVPVRAAGHVIANPTGATALGHGPGCEPLSC
jgi:hypothetical protein